MGNGKWNTSWKDIGFIWLICSDWVRDVAWAPSFGLDIDTIASCSQDRTVLIFTNEKGSWMKKPLKTDLFGDCVWRLSWSLSGNVLAVSCGDNKVHK